MRVIWTKVLALYRNEQAGDTSMTLQTSLMFPHTQKTLFKHNTWLKLKGDRHPWSQSIECEYNMCYAQRNFINKHAPFMVKIRKANLA